jgi:hypothetical protein
MIIQQQDLEKRSTIQVSEDLRNALKDLGKKGETYEDIIWRLIDYWNSSHNVRVTMG